MSNPQQKEIDTRIGALYEQPIRSRRSGALFNAFSYPTKIDPEAVALFIAVHTLPGHQILDVFAGSGTTGIASRLCESPTDNMLQQANTLGLDIQWGPRSVILYEISPIASHVAEVLCNPPEPNEFVSAARAIVRSASNRLGWMYTSKDPKDELGVLRHTIWSDILICMSCQTQISVWDAAVQLNPPKISKVVECLSCHIKMPLSNASRLTQQYFDPLTKTECIQKTRIPVAVYGRTGTWTWRRESLSDDIELLEQVNSVPLPAIIPNHMLVWGDLYRSGYHNGITHLHHLYTRRNLLALSTLWEETFHHANELRLALQLWVLSYNTTHSTLMTRAVAKARANDLVVTGAQPGVMYISSLPVEKNVFVGVERKIRTFADAFQACHGAKGHIKVINASSTALQIPDSSIDYVFTDPPFGDYIPYAEINQINEAWLGSLTNKTEEAIVSQAQHKGINDYESLMTDIFSEVRRVLKPSGAATVAFHASKPEVWEALGTYILVNPNRRVSAGQRRFLEYQWQLP